MKALFERAMQNSYALEEAEFRLRYFHHWAKSEITDCYDAALDIDQDFDKALTKCKNVIRPLDIRK